MNKISINVGFFNEYLIAGVGSRNIVGRIVRCSTGQLIKLSVRRMDSFICFFSETFIKIKYTEKLSVRTTNEIAHANFL